MAEDQEYLTPLQREYLSRNPQATLVPSEPANEGHAQTISHSNPTGVGGWLGLLVVGLIGLGPLITLTTTAQEIFVAESKNLTLTYNSAWQSVKSLIWIISILYCAISIYAGWRLISRKTRRTVPIVVACIWIAGPGLTIFSLFAINFWFGVTDTSGFGAELARPFVFCAIWTPYLLMSKRVANTYRD